MSVTRAKILRGIRTIPTDCELSYSCQTRRFRSRMSTGFLGRFRSRLMPKEAKGSSAQLPLLTLSASSSGNRPVPSNCETGS
jgi:hypothetical protein